MQQRSEETRQHILEAALKRFANHGYNAASVDDICTEAGVSKGAFYHHFPTKQALFLALLNGWLDSIDAGFEAVQGATVPETLMNMTRLLPGIFAAADGRLPMFLEFWLQASRDEKVWKATTEPYQRYQNYFAGLVRQGIQEGSFRKVDAEAAAQMLVSLAVGMLLQGLLAPDDTNWQKTAQQGMQVLLKGLEA
jgi:AcrR family transcriptional regulator